MTTVRLGPVVVLGDLMKSLVTMGAENGLGRPLTWRRTRRGNKSVFVVDFSKHVTVHNVIFEGKVVPCRAFMRKHRTKPHRSFDRTRRNQHTCDQLREDDWDENGGCQTKLDFILHRSYLAQNTYDKYYSDDEYDDDDDLEDVLESVGPFNSSEDSAAHFKTSAGISSDDDEAMCLCRDYDEWCERTCWRRHFTLDDVRPI